MGLIKKEEKEGDKKDAPEPPEDPPIVKKLKEIDDKYLELEREYEREVQRLVVQYTKKQQPLLEERKKVLTAMDGDGPVTGTPALQGFWLKAMKNHPAFEEAIQEWDEPVLEYLADIEKSHADESDANKGFKLVFHFVENPYFTNLELTKEYRTEVGNPYCGEIEVKEVKSTSIEWKAGKDVTVEKVAKKVKGGGAKKAKQKKDKEARPSFFREFFRSLCQGVQLMEDAREQARMMADDGGEEDDDDDDEALVSYLMENDHETGTAVRDHLIPFAVRWYTGEAAPEGDDDDDEEDSDDDEDHGSDDEDDDEDDEPLPRGGRQKPAAAAAKKKMLPRGEGGKAKSTHSEGPPPGAPKEECKQQ